MKAKLSVVFILGLLLVGCVSAVGIYRYSEPTYSNGDNIDWKEADYINKPDCIKEEWNNNFQKWRSGEITKEEMKKYMGYCRW